MGQGEMLVGLYERFWVGTTLKAGFVTGNAGVWGVGKRVSNVLSDENGSGVPFSS